MRKIINISTAGVQNNASTQCNWVTTAVCDDGTVWFIRDNDTEWRQTPDIPTDSTPSRRSVQCRLSGWLQLELQHEPAHGVDATPDHGYVLRILGAHLDRQNWNCVVTADPPNTIVDVMNYSSERRAVFLAHAISVLVFNADKERHKLDSALAKVDEKWQSLLDQISGKTPEASAPPPT